MLRNLYLFICLIPQISIAQIEIITPKNRSVYQRDNGNIGKIPVNFTIDKKVDSVFAIFTSLDSPNTGEKQQFLLKNDSNKGFISDLVSIKGGWYKLEIQTFLQGKLLYEKQIERVGAGEVIVIGGQSNAQGIKNFGAKGAVDDRVNSVNYTNNTFNLELPEKWEISQLGPNTDIAPTGNGPWCWGRVGDALVKDLGVPVLFINCAWQSTLSINWYESHLKRPTFSAIFRQNFPDLFPYAFIDQALRNFVAAFGARCMLWQLGETDTNPGVPDYTEYYQYIRHVMENSRKDTGMNLPWVISRTSYSGFRTSDEILRAQNDLIKTEGLNAFAGPFTDTIMIPRWDGVHFSNLGEVKGIDLLADAWTQVLNKNFIESLEPVFALPTIPLKLSCKTSLEVEASLPNGIRLKKWKGTNSTNQKITLAKSGAFAEVVDSFGNTRLTSGVHAKPLTAARSLKLEYPLEELCPGDRYEVSASDFGETLKWNTAVSSISFEGDTAGVFFYEGFNALGCSLGISDTAVVNYSITPPFANAKTVQVEGSYSEKSELSLVACPETSLQFFTTDAWKSSSWNGLPGNTYQATEDTIRFIGTFGNNCRYENQPITVKRMEKPIGPLFEPLGNYYAKVSNFKDKPEGTSWFTEQNGQLSELTILELNKETTYSLFAIKDSLSLSCRFDFPKVSFPLGLFKREILAYPVPLGNMLTIEPPTLLAENSLIQIINVLGNVVLEKSIPNSSGLLSLDISHLTTGKYYLIISYGNQKETIALIK